MHCTCTCIEGEVCTCVSVYWFNQAPPPFSETSLAGSPVQTADPPVLNGLGDLNLCSSRGRSKRDSVGKRNSGSEDSSPLHTRRTSQDGKSSVSGRSPKKNRQSDTEPKLSADFLMSMLSSSNFGDLDFDSEEEDINPSLSPTHADVNPSPSRTHARSKAVTSEPEADRSGLAGADSEVVLRNRTRDGEAAGKTSFDEQKSVKKLNRDTTILEEDGDEASFRMRGRSNAIDVRSASNFRSKASPMSPKTRDSTVSARPAEEKRTSILKETEVAEENKELRRSSSIKGEEPGLHRSSGSWRRKKQLSGEQALGMFYHNRRSQMFDPGDLDDAEKGLEDRRGASLERSNSSASRSPTQRSSRDSRSFSPIPHSPLVAKGYSFDQVTVCRGYFPSMRFECVMIIGISAKLSWTQ